MKSILLCCLFFSFSICCFAQMNSVTGTIYDEDKNMLADANVIVKNSKEGTSTNKKGQFTLDTQKDAILEISYLGFETQEIVVGNHKEITIMLKSEWETIDPVVLVAYGKTIRCKSTLCCGHCSVTGSEIIYEKSEEFKRISSEQSLTSLFPNPSANGLFQLQLDKNYEKLTIEIFNMNGQLIQTSTRTKLSKIPQIDLSNQAKGIYLIRIIADGNVLETKKAVKL